MKVASYQTKKSTLKKELDDTVYSADVAPLPSGTPSR